MKAKSKNILIFSICAGLIVAASIILCCVFFIKPLETIKISCQSSISLYVNEKVKLDVEVSDESAQVEYRSGNSNVVAVEGEYIYGLKEGSTTVRVEAITKNQVAHANILVTVKKEITDLDIGIEENITLYLLDKNKEEAYSNNIFDYLDFSCPKDVNYSIDDASIVSVENNKIIAQKEGVTNIIFYSVSRPEITSIHTITVLSVEPDILLKSSETINLNVGDTVSIDFMIVPSYYTGEAFIYIDISEPIVNLTYSVLTALEEGSCVLKIFVDDKVKKIININVASSKEGIENNSDNTFFNEGDYTLVVKTHKCSVNGEIIQPTSNNATLEFAILDKNGCTLDYEISIFGSCLSRITGGVYLINATVDDSFVVSCSVLGISKTLYIVFD